jgi:hypothetical protein
MNLNVPREVAALRRMTTKELKEKYAEVFGEQTAGNHKEWLVKRIAWRLQALAEGGLSERAKRRAEELANDADLRMNPPREATAAATPEVAGRTATATLPFRPDDRLPPPGTVLTRVYRGESLQVKVLAEGFEFEGKVFGSLSAAARAITGSHVNGFAFFRLGANGGNP